MLKFEFDTDAVAEPRAAHRLGDLVRLDRCIAPRRRRQLRPLRKDKPHPVGPFLAGPEFAQRCIENRLFCRYEAFEIEGIGHLNGLDVSREASKSSTRISFS